MSYKYLLSEEESISLFPGLRDMEHSPTKEQLLVERKMTELLDSEGKEIHHWNYGRKNLPASNEKNRISQHHRYYYTEEGIRHREKLRVLHSGSNNVISRKTLIVYKGITKVYDCLVEFQREYPHIPKQTLYTICQRSIYSTKYDLYGSYDIEKTPLTNQWKVLIIHKGISKVYPTLSSVLSTIDIPKTVLWRICKGSKYSEKYDLYGSYDTKSSIQSTTKEHSPLTTLYTGKV
jgi:hypothetical protein